MLKINKILYATDFSECAKHVLPHALYLMKKYDAELHMLHAIVLHPEDPHNPAYYFSDEDELYQRLKDNAYERMKSEIEYYNSDFFRIIKVQERGIAPAPVILEYADKKEIDLIVLGSSGHRGYDRSFLGNVSEEVVRLAICPVLTIHEPQKNLNIESKNYILVPLDFSVHSKTALEYAKKIAPIYNAQLQLLHVVEESSHPPHYASVKSSVSEFIPDIKNNSEKIMREFLSEVKGPDADAKLLVIEGRAAHDIVKFANDQKINMIILATHGLTGIEHLHLGSVSEKVVRMANCPVLTVPVFGKSLL
jgi:nucleotide-binding universal stress UspA family protein